MTTIGAFYASLQADIHVYHTDRVMFVAAIHNSAIDVTQLLAIATVQ